MPLRPSRRRFRPTEEWVRKLKPKIPADPKTIAVNDAMQKLFGLEKVPRLRPQDFNVHAYYTDEPSRTYMIEVGGRSFGLEIYVPEQAMNKNIWLVTQHGYGGNPSDWSRLASILKKEGIGIASLGMHVSGKDDYEMMSMRSGEWADVASQAPSVIEELQNTQLIFVGQSAGGTAGAVMLARGKKAHPYTAAVLIGPTLIPPVAPELVAKMDRNLHEIIGEQDVLLSWDWFTHAIHQMHDDELNRAYQAYYTTLPGYPVRAAAECLTIPAHVLNNLSAIDVPTILVKGRKDAVDEKSLPAARTALAGQHQSHIMFANEPENTGHQMHIENPEATAAIIRQLIQTMSMEQDA
jgi:pimeloyl-ACP methyl ester carboxylesterase